MKKMIIVLVVVICAQLILTLCYKEKSKINRCDFNAVYLFHGSTKIHNDSVISIDKGSNVVADIILDCDVKHLKSEDNIPQILNFDDNMCNIYFNDELLYNDLNYLDKNGFISNYKRTKDFFGTNVDYHFEASRLFPIEKSGEYKIEMILKLKIGGEEVLKRISMKFTAIVQDDKDK